MVAPLSQAEGEPRVIARPPILHAAFLIAGLGIGALAPMPLGPAAARWPVAAALAAFAIAVMRLAMRRFAASGVAVKCDRAVPTLVTDGIYRWSRNPMYIALAVLYAAVAIAADSGAALLLGVPLLAVMEFGVIRREERYLEARFGERYRDYRASGIRSAISSAIRSRCRDGARSGCKGMTVRPRCAQPRRGASGRPATGRR
ncbi:MAG: isoprenylcysteine carboxylmethyltransferase family protein [Alphaproteobacteria bacterium]|nr:isoprenylcysteine carboxylmethyltransferase family protein [Alphaproteobacteria bacterium]